MEALFSQSEQNAASVETQTEAGRTNLAIRYRDHAIRLNMEGCFAESEAYLREALRIRPDDVDILNELGVALWRQGRSAEAEAVYLRASRLEPRDFRILTNLGLALYSLGRIEEAGASFRNALENRPDTFDAVMNLGIVLTDQGDFDEALTWLNRAHELRPGSADALQNLGMNLACQGRLGEAISYFDRALELKPESAEGHRNLAYALLCAGDYERGWREHEWRLKCQRSGRLSGQRQLLERRRLSRQDAVATRGERLRRHPSVHSLRELGQASRRPGDSAVPGPALAAPGSVRRCRSGF